MFASNSTFCTVPLVQENTARKKLSVREACVGWTSLIGELCARPIRTHSELALHAATALDAWMFVQESEQQPLTPQESLWLDQLRTTAAGLEEHLKEEARTRSVVDLAKAELLDEEGDEELVLFTVQLEHLSYYDPVITVTNHYTRRRDGRQRLVIGPRWLYQIVQFSASLYAGRTSEAVVAPHSELEQELIVLLWDAAPSAEMSCLVNLSDAVSAIASN